tara:strand:+ start:309 stop:689 length:381 start_codon:yes stop_codon:yes gene_type:complete
MSEDYIEDKLVDEESSIPEKRLSYAHQVNLKLVDVIKDRQSKKYHLSIALIFIKLVLVFIIATGIITKRTLDDGWKEVILVIVGGYISSFAKLVEFWYNSPADDQELVRSSQDYRTGVNGNGKYYK